MNKHSHLLIINGKKAEDPQVRAAIYRLRDEGYDLQVRVTWEGSDVLRFVEEAVNTSVQTLIAAGGDGTINAVSNALMTYPAPKRPVLGILPMGTANDFATALTLPEDLSAALDIALKGHAYPIDLGCVNDTHYFINIATGGFGTKITTETPEALKSALGGVAYFIHGIARLDMLKADYCTINADKFAWEDEALVIGVGNGRQAGGGQQLCPSALINDGLLNLTVVAAKELLPSLFSSLFNRDENKNIIEIKSTWVTIHAEHEMVFNLDGEPLSGKHFEFKVIPEAIHCRLPPNCDLLS